MCFRSLLVAVVLGASTSALWAHQSEVYLPLNSDGLGEIEFANYGTIPGRALASGVKLAQDVGNRGSGAALLKTSKSFLWHGTGGSDFPAGTISIRVKLDPNAASEGDLLTGAGSGKIPQLRVIAKKDAKGWQIIATSRYWNLKRNNWSVSRLTDSNRRFALQGKWTHVAYTWGKRGKELWVDNKRIAHDSTDTSMVGQLWRVGVGDILAAKEAKSGQTLVGIYDEFRFEKRQMTKLLKAEPAEDQSVHVVADLRDGLLVPDHSMLVETDKKTGRVLGVKSMLPNPVAISNGLEAHWRTESGEKTVHVGQEHESTSTDAFDVSTHYSIESDRVTVIAKFIARRALNKPSRLELRSRFDRESWPYIIHYTSPKRRLPSHRSHLLWYGEDENDLSRSCGITGWKGGVPILPFIALERGDRYVVCGPLDLNSSMTLSSNESGSYAPAVQLNPKTCKPGQVFELSLTFGNVVRRGKGYKDYADVIDWYMSHCYSTHRLTRDLFAWPRPPRHPATEGNMWSYSGRMQNFSQASLEEWVESRERELENTFTKYLWLYGWHSVDETYPIQGDYLLTRSYRDWSAQKTLKEIRRLQKKGYKVCMYFRQFAISELVREDRPPYPSWVARDHKGEVITYDNASFPVPPERQEAVGSDKVSWVHLNFAIDECRRWYTQQVKNVIDHYQPDGISWDMGWGGGDVGHATFRIQADVTRWLKEKYPHMTIIQNGDGTPSQLYADLILVENTQVGSGNPEAKTPLDYVASNAFGQSAAGVDKQYLIGFVSKKLKCDPRKLHIELSLRALGLGTTIGYPVDYPELKEALRFSAKLMNVPYRMFGIDAKPFSHKIDASLWAGSGKCMVAVFNNAEEGLQQEVRVDPNYLQEVSLGRKSVRWQLIGVGGPLGQAKTSPIEGDCVWKGAIPSKSLLILTVMDMEARE